MALMKGNMSIINNAKAAADHLPEIDSNEAPK